MKAKGEVTIRGTVVAPERATAASAEQQAQRRSWLVLYLAFANWCLIAALATGWFLHYRATATYTHLATLDVSQGVVSYQPSAASEPRLMTRSQIDVAEGTTIQTGPNSRAALTLFEGSHLTLLSDAAVHLVAMRTGVFDEGNTDLRMSIDGGPALLTVTGALSSGVTIHFSDGYAQLREGEYLVWPQEDLSRLLVYEGEATVWDAETVLTLTTGQRAIFEPEGDLWGPLALAEDLVRNGDFANGLEGWQPLDDLEVPHDSIGQRRIEAVRVDGRSLNALRVARETEIDRHNKTGVIQEINRDVRGFRSLKLHALVKVESSKLDGGGYAGTEYPMTFVVYYVNERGGEPNWIQGFFFRNDQNRPTQFGERIPQGEWQEYEVELMSLADRPAFIRSLWVFGAGHDFDALVADIELLAR